MARKRMVTRTIKTTEANVLCLNIESAEPFEQVVILSGTYKDNKSLMKAVSKRIDNDEVKAVHVIESVEKETLYGMEENDFIAHATELPPRQQ